MVLNEKAFEHARKLISQGKIETDAKWSEERPALTAKVDPIGTMAWDDYSLWFLGENIDAAPLTKSRVRFPYGDFDKVYRGALIVSQYKAKQFGFRKIYDAITQLIDQIDKNSR